MTQPSPKPTQLPPEGENPLSERKQTDESLRLEREHSDRALEDELAAIDQTADFIIRRARTRADEVLAAARLKSDQHLAEEAPGQPPPSRIIRQRVREDQVLGEERASADETLRQERADQVSLATREREETDKDLLMERVSSDDVLATLGEVLSVAGNDLRSILDMIVGSAGIIATEVSREGHGGPVLLHARRIQRSGVRMSRRIEDLVDVAAAEAGLLTVAAEVGDPAAIVAEVVEAFRTQAADRGVAVEVEIVPPASLAKFDAARILQVLTSLLSNAIKFTAAGGKVTVHVERAGDYIRFAVSDTGTGVAADKLEAVFERFRLINKYQPRGVGLYVSKFIVQAHGGRMWAESRVGEGSTFYFSLPIHVD